tara:strand:- start:2067 stop:2738 length:672 start_codon:yes stop_codon:yes gene_type:complete
MDTSEAVLDSYLTYGGSDRTAAKDLSTSKSLNYAKGASLVKPVIENVNTAGYSITFTDSVGIMGPENYFVKFNLDIIDAGNNYEAEEGWIALFYSAANDSTVNTYVTGTNDLQADTVEVNGFAPANFSNSIPNYIDGVIKITLDNLKTNNHFVDSWLDARLYTQDRLEFPFDTMYVGLKDSFYLGIHARDKRRIPYNIKCTVTTDVRSYSTLSSEEREFSAKY